MNVREKSRVKEPLQKGWSGMGRQLEKKKKRKKDQDCSQDAFPRRGLIPAYEGEETHGKGEIGKKAGRKRECGVTGGAL